MNLIELLRSLGLEIETDDITEVSDEQLAAALEALNSSYTDAREAADVEAARQAADAVEAIRAEEARREAAAAEVEAELAELDRRVAGETTPEEGEGTEGGDGDGNEAEEPAAAPAEGEETEGEGEGEGEGEAETEGAEERELVHASATPARTEERSVAAQRRIMERAARRARMPQAPAAHRTLPDNGRAAVVTAGADLQGLSPGQRFRSIEQLGEVTAQRIHSLQQAQRSNPSMGGRFLIASVEVDYPDGRVLGSDPQQNADRIEAVVASAQAQSWDAITAAGGLCAPTDVRYELFGVGDDRRPIRDSLVRFNARRGGVRFIRPPIVSDLATATVVWTEANDTTPADPTTKPCLTITCGAEVEEVIDAVTMCLRVGNFSRRTFPEQFARFWQLAGVNHAREAETQLWTRMLADTGVVDVTTGELLGAARDILENLRQAATAYRSRFRMPQTAVLRVIMPDWVPDLMAADLIRQAPGDQTMATALAEIEGFFRAARIVATYSPDTGQEFGAQTDGAALLRWPNAVEMLMFAEGTYIYLDGGQLDFGMEIRDSTLNALNDSQAFMESFEGEALVGNQAVHLTLNVCPDGSSSLPIDISPCTTGS